MEVAEITAKLSYAKRLQVGAVIVKGDSMYPGHNGMPEGWENECEYRELQPKTDEAGNTTFEPAGTLKTKPEVIHAEINALSKIARSTASSEDAILFCTTAPCVECAKSIHQAGIKTVYYRDEYRDSTGIEFLKKSKVNVYKYSP